jgi:purine-nucleoside phosphorylase
VDSEAESARKYIAEMDEATEFLRSFGRKVDTLAVLGSGLGKVLSSAQDKLTVPYVDVPHFPRSTVAGHGGQVTFCKLGSRNMAVLEGRVHCYERHPASRVAFHVRTLIQLGAKAMIITNAAGGANAAFKAGDLMAIDNHISLFVEDPGFGDGDQRLGERFYDTAYCYDPGLIEKAMQEAKKLNIDLKRGVYAMTRGPRYESAADVNALRIMGADAVGMSTVPEVLAARRMGVDKVFGLTLVSNLAAGVSPTRLHHEEVIAAGKAATDKIAALLGAFLARTDW